jgi:hypothetical protein
VAEPKRKKRARPDWEQIEREYRAGRTGRSIAREHGADESSIRARARKHGWSRDLTGAVRVETANAAIRSLADNAANDRDIVAQAAQRGADILASQRSLGGRLRVLVEARVSEMEEMDKDASAPKGGKALSERCRILSTLAVTAQRVVDLERKAWGLDALGEKDQDETPLSGHQDLLKRLEAQL